MRKEMIDSRSFGRKRPAAEGVLTMEPRGVTGSSTSGTKEAREGFLPRTLFGEATTWGGTSAAQAWLRLEALLGTAEFEQGVEVATAFGETLARGGGGFFKQAIVKAAATSALSSAASLCNVRSSSCVE